MGIVHQSETFILRCISEEPVWKPLKYYNFSLKQIYLQYLYNTLIGWNGEISVMNVLVLCVSYTVNFLDLLLI